MGEPVDTVLYGYNDGSWGDLLTSYDGQTITHDNIGNPLFDGTWTYTWEQGRQLASMSNGTTTWEYTYDANGMRTSRTNGSDSYTYVYNGSQLVQMTRGSDTLYFTYGANGPLPVTWNGTTYYYVLDAFGTIEGLISASGTVAASYVYDAWGNIILYAGSMASTLGILNPLVYRNYVYDHETELYYLQSRYYDPELGRFLNADAFTSTGQGILGNNMFVYCNNIPSSLVDPTGQCPHDGRFYDSGPFEGQFEYNPNCWKCAMHGEFWLCDKYGNLYDLTQYEPHEFSQMAICTDGAEDSFGSNTHQNMTSYSINGEYMDPSIIHYVVAPVGYAGVKDGDLALVIDLLSGRSVYAIVGDRGPAGKFNEVSLSTAWDLGYSWADGTRGPKGNFLILYFPGTRKTWKSVNELADYLE